MPLSLNMKMRSRFSSIAMSFYENVNFSGSGANHRQYEQSATRTEVSPTSAEVNIAGRGGVGVVVSKTELSRQKSFLPLHLFGLLSLCFVTLLAAAAASVAEAAITGTTSSTSIRSIEDENGKKVKEFFVVIMCVLLVSLPLHLRELCGFITLFIVRSNGNCLCTVWKL